MTDSLCLAFLLRVDVNWGGKKLEASPLEELLTICQTAAFCQSSLVDCHYTDFCSQVKAKYYNDRANNSLDLQKLQKEFFINKVVTASVYVSKLQFKIVRRILNGALLSPSQRTANVCSASKKKILPELYWHFTF